jgi:Asp/Glu/hydantoin racemase
VSSPPCAGLLHTATIHGETFHDLLAEAAPGVEQVHVTDPRLLAATIRTGVTPEVQAEVTRHIDHLVASGATAVLVTCSSIGEAVEAAGEHASVPVLRLDEPMAREAAAIAGPTGRIAILATLRSTLGPTTRLIRRAAGEDAEITAEVVAGAADARLAGDQATHDDLVRKAIATAQADVVVLAQATMASAATDTGVQVLTSPRSGVAALVEAIREPHPHGGVDR